MAEQLNLKGNVKSVRVSSANSKEYSGQFIKTYFDENGRIIKRETKYILSDNYIYNEQGRLISYNARVLSSGHIAYYQLQYDKRGFLISDGFTNYKNDENGNWIEVISNSGIVRRKYNQKNQVVEEWMYYGEGQIMHTWGVDENGNHWEMDEEILPEGNHILYEYNELDNVIYRKIANTDQSDTITYKYDEKGNWTERFQTIEPFAASGSATRPTLCVEQLLSALAQAVAMPPPAARLPRHLFLCMFIH